MEWTFCSKAVWFTWSNGLEEWMNLSSLGMHVALWTGHLEVEQSRRSLDQANTVQTLGKRRFNTRHGAEGKCTHSQVLPSSFSCAADGCKELISRWKSARFCVNLIDSSSSASCTSCISCPQTVALVTVLPILAVSLCRTFSFIHWLLHQMSKVHKKDFLLLFIFLSVIQSFLPFSTCRHKNVTPRWKCCSEM